MEEIKRKVEKLRKNSKNFNDVLEEATSKIEKLIMQRNTAKSVTPTDSRNHKMRIKVTALPLTKEEMVTLKEYINKKYIDDVSGDYFMIYYSIFSKKYIVKSSSYISSTSNWWEDDW